MKNGYRFLAIGGALTGALVHSAGPALADYDTCVWNSSNSSYTCTANKPYAAKQYTSTYSQPIDNTSYYAGSAGAAMKMLIYQRTGVAYNATDLVNTCNDYEVGNTWPEGCSPQGMGKVVDSKAPSPEIWTYWTGSTQSTGIGYQCYHIALEGYPFAVPIYGQPDHWTMVFGMKLASLPTSPSSCSYSRVSMYEGLSSSQYDGGDPASGVDGRSGFSGQRDVTSGDWTYLFYVMMNTSHMAGTTYANKYVLVYEPLEFLPDGVEAIVDAIDAAGVVGPRERMSELKARQRVFQALENAEFDLDENWEDMERTIPGEATLVESTWQDGTIADYYLVPLVNREGKVAYSVMLDAVDGHWRELLTPEEPPAYRPVDEVDAKEVARRYLRRGERLVSQGLQFDPMVESYLMRNPHDPLQVFTVVDAAGRSLREVAVAHMSGQVFELPL